ncbi:hypothetical protein NBCG_01584 [Nocardioidaceae bacterium Broad-1]|nr:hypothetical protein NBCG_01584 [Nocardioidaceae bacterium Broad-1]
MPKEFQDAAHQWCSETIDAMTRQIHPVLSAFTTETIDDFPVDEDNEAVMLAAPLEASPSMRFFKFGHRLIVTVDEVRDFDVDALLTTLYAMADDIGGQKADSVIGLIEEMCEANGQTIASPDGDVYEGILEALDTMEIDFDDDGRHDLSLISGTDLTSRMAIRPPTIEQQLRGRAILERKHAEWRASRRRRELP